MSVKNKKEERLPLTDAVSPQVGLLSLALKFILNDELFKKIKQHLAFPEVGADEETYHPKQTSFGKHTPYVQ